MKSNAHHAGQQKLPGNFQYVGLSLHQNLLDQLAQVAAVILNTVAVDALMQTKKD